MQTIPDSLAHLDRGGRGRGRGRGPGRGRGDEEGHLSRSVVFEILSNERRRWVLRYLFGLAEGAKRATLYVLSKQLAAWENGVPTERVTSKQRKRLYTALKQAHLPKMDDAGVIDYDVDRGLVELDDRADGLKVYLEVVPENEIPWSEFYLGLGVLWSAILGAVWAGLTPFTLVPDLAWAGVVTGSFVASALAHLYVQRQARIDRDALAVDSPTQ